MEDNKEMKQKMATNNTGRRKRKRTYTDHNNKPPWSDLLHELLEMIKKRLLFIDRMNFRAVCKSWNCIEKVPPLQQMPWLLVFDYDDEANSSCKLVDSSNKKTYMINATAITDKLKMTKRSPFLHVHESKFGWLLVSSCYSKSFSITTALFLYSPFLGEKINLIDLPILSSRVSLATFTSNPLDDEDCTVLTLHTNDSDNTVHIYTYRRGQRSWDSFVFKCECLQMKVVRWMYSEGIFYYVTLKGVVGKFDFVREEWNVFPTLPTTKHRVPPGLHYHMVKSDGKLFLILEYNLNEPRIRSWSFFAHHIYRLDLSSMIWEDLSSIGDRVLFIGDGYNSVLNASVMKFNGERKGILDKIYYSAYYELKYCSVHDYTLRKRDSGKPRKLDCSRHYGSIAKERYCMKLLIDPPSC